MNEILINDELFKKTTISTYYASNKGRVANITFNDSNDMTAFKVIKQDISSAGYCRVPLKVKPGVEKKFLVHRLVYETFIGPLHDNVVDHIDSNKENNKPENLRSCTQKDNIAFAIEKNNFNGNKKFIIIKEKATGEVIRFNSLKEMNMFLGYGESYTKGMKSTKTAKFKNKYELLDTK